MHGQIHVTLISTYLLNNEDYNSVSKQFFSIDYAQRWSVKKLLLEISQNSQENIYEFYEISKNTLSYRTRPVAASQCIQEH